MSTESVGPGAPVEEFVPQRGFFARLAHLARSYKALFHLSWSEMLQYRAAVFVWTLWSLAQPVVQLSVWSSIIRAEGEMGGYDTQSIAAYFIVQSVIYHFTGAWQAYEFGYYIRMGTLSMWLLRPLDPSHQFVSGNISFKLMNLIWLIPIWTGLVLYFKPEIPLTLSRLLVAFVALVSAATLSFIWAHCWAMLAFWTVRAASMFDLASTIGFLIGGGIAPVGLLPDALQAAARYLPFYYMSGMPIEVTIGAISIGQSWLHVLISITWTLVFFIGYRLLWRAGIKRYGAVGA